MLNVDLSEVEFDLGHEVILVDYIKMFVIKSYYSYLSLTTCNIEAKLRCFLGLCNRLLHIERLCKFKASFWHI